MVFVALLLFFALSAAMLGLLWVGLFLMREGWLYGIPTGIVSSAVGLAAVCTSVAYFFEVYILAVERLT